MEVEISTATRIHPSPRRRSKVTNGKSLFAVAGNMQSPWARRVRDLIGLHLNDLGGYDEASTAEQVIARRVAVLVTEMEQLELQLSVTASATTKQAIEQATVRREQLALCVNMSAEMRNLLKAIGVKRRPRDVTPPTLADIEAEIRAQEIGEANPP